MCGEVSLSCNGDLASGIVRLDACTEFTLVDRRCATERDTLALAGKHLGPGWETPWPWLRNTLARAGKHLGLSGLGQNQRAVVYPKRKYRGPNLAPGRGWSLYALQQASRPVFAAGVFERAFYVGGTAPWEACGSTTSDVIGPALVLAPCAALAIILNPPFVGTAASKRGALARLRQQQHRW